MFLHVIIIWHNLDFNQISFQYIFNAISIFLPELLDLFKKIMLIEQTKWNRIWFNNYNTEIMQKILKILNILINWKNIKFYFKI